MRYNKTFSDYTPITLSVFLLFTILCSGEVGASMNNPTIGDRIAGTYLLREDEDGGSRIVTITSDGCWFGIHLYQLNNKFSNQHGVWKKTGDKKIAVRTLNFSSLEDGIGSSLFSFTVEFDKSYQQMSGELYGKLFPPEADPLDPLAIPIRTFSNTFTGKRLIVTDR